MDQQVEELRTAFLNELDSKGRTTIHQKDYERVKNDNDWLKRFLMHNESDQKQAVSMMWEALTWRKEFGTNDITESSLKMEILVGGGFFSHGKDKDGCTLFVFKCKKYVKGAHDSEDIKKCVIYWMERLEREDKGKPITLFFDMENCGLANMDMDFTKYLIGLFKSYYPYFLNYILIFEMPWILSAAFKVIKSWLPEKAVQKIKFVNKKDIKEYVPLDQALTCWGGNDEYVFSFVPDVQEVSSIIAPNNKKVHFADGSPMSETSVIAGDKDHDGGILSVQPSPIITFVKEGNESVSTLELHNTDNNITLSYKLKTTSPEKFRVRPSAGCLAPGARVTITVTVLPGFMVGSLSRDKFLVTSMPVDNVDLTSQELAELWKNTTGKKVYQHHLKCAMKPEFTKNGNAVSCLSTTLDGDQTTISQLSSRLSQISDSQNKLQNSLRSTQYLQLATMIMVIIFGIVLTYVIPRISEIASESQAYCRNFDNP